MFNMRVRVINDEIVAYGIECLGEDTYEGAPVDYSPDRYDYIPIKPGVYSTANFVKKHIDEIWLFLLKTIKWG